MPYLTSLCSNVTGAVEPVQLKGLAGETNNVLSDVVILQLVAQFEIWEES